MAKGPKRGKAKKPKTKTVEKKTSKARAAEIRTGHARVKPGHAKMKSSKKISIKKAANVKATKKKVVQLPKSRKAARKNLRTATPKSRKATPISSPKSIAEDKTSEMLADELSKIEKEGIAVYEFKRKGVSAAEPAEPAGESEGKPGREPGSVMKAVRGLIRDNKPREEKKFDPESKDLRLRRQSILEDIEAKRDQIRRIPRNGQHRERLISLSQQLTAMKRELWEIEAQLRQAAKEE